MRSRTLDRRSPIRPARQRQTSMRDPCGTLPSVAVLVELFSYRDRRRSWLSWLLPRSCERHIVVYAVLGDPPRAVVVPSKSRAIVSRLDRRDRPLDAQRAFWPARRRLLGTHDVVNDELRVYGSAFAIDLDDRIEGGMAAPAKSGVWLHQL